MSGKIYYFKRMRNGNYNQGRQIVNNVILNTLIIIKKKIIRMC